MKKFLLMLMLLPVLFAANAETTYTFSSNDWKATPDNWTAVKNGNAYQKNQGVQVTNGTSGAGATSPVEFTNVTKVVFNYCTNAKAGAGSIVVKFGEEEFGSYAVTKPAANTGTTLRDTDPITHNTPMSGKLTFVVYCSANSIYINSITIYEEEGGVTVAAPTFSVEEGEIAAGTSVTLSSQTEGATIYWATETELSTTTPQGTDIAAKNHTGAITVTTDETYYAVAEKDGTYSKVVSATYLVVDQNTNTLAIDFSDENLWKSWGVTIPEAGKGTYLTDNDFTKFIKDCITITWKDGASDSQHAVLWNNSKSGLDLRTYAGGGLTFTAAPGTKILSIKVGNNDPVYVNDASYTFSDKGNYTTVTIKYQGEQVTNFDDDTYYCYKSAYTADEVIYTRDITDATVWNAICLPFEVPNDKWAKEYKVLALTGVDSNETAVEFEYLTTEDLEANTPYLIKPINEEATEIGFIMKNVEVSPATATTSITQGGVTLTGNYGACYLADGEYALAGGVFKKAVSNYNVLKSFRAYLTFPSTINLLPIKIAGESGIVGIEAEAAQDGVFYDLQGRKAVNPTSGLYILNGHKVIIK